ncbi:MAG: response regulator [Myxococcales bacterium]
MGKNTTVLIVDDDRAIQRLLADTLAREGFSVIVEKDGEWALKTFEQKQVDAVILDLLLPAINGFEVARRMRMLPKGRSTPLLFVSGVYKSSGHRHDAREKYGVVEFLDKPINMTRLKNALRTALGPKYPKREAEAERRAEVDAQSAETFADSRAREEVDEVENAARRVSGNVSRAVKGDFAKKPFPELLAELYRWKATGALLLRKEKVKKIVYFRDGRPFSVKSNLLSECLGKIMVREKMISEAECEESLKRMKASGRQQGTVLIEMGCISPHNLVYALSLQLQTKLFDLFGWTAGEYQFNPDAEIPSESTTLDMTTAQIIYEGIKRAYDEFRVRGALGVVDKQYVHPSKDPLYLFQDIGLDEEELALLTAIDGHKTVSTLVALSLLPPLETLRFLYAMRCSQMVEFSPESADGPVEPKLAGLRQAAAHEPVTEETPLPDAMPPPLPPPLPANRAASAAPPPPAPVRNEPVVVRAAGSLLPELSGVMPSLLSAEEREVRERLAATAAAMKKKDYFAILGVAPNAPRDDIRRAYFAMAKEYHPDKHFGSYSAEVKNLAGQIFDLISTAHDTLIDDEERERYLAEIASGVKKDVSDELSKILAAEGKFQRGEDLLTKKQYREAHALFEEAVKLYAQEGEFHAYLGWSLFQADPRSEQVATEAIEHIETAIRLNPKVDKSYLFLGYIQKALGRPDRAERQFEKAIQCNPDCTEALRELRLLGRARK